MNGNFRCAKPRSTLKNATAWVAFFYRLIANPNFRFLQRKHEQFPLCNDNQQAHMYDLAFCEFKYKVFPYILFTQRSLAMCITPFYILCSKL